MGLTLWAPPCMLAGMNLSYRTAAAIGFILAGTGFAALGADRGEPVSLLNGRDLTGWKTVGNGTSEWAFGHAIMDPDHPAKLKLVGPGDELISTNKTVNLSSERVFGDCILEVEYLVGKSTPGNANDSNSGVKMMNIYEIQIFDSYGKTTLSKVDAGAVYGECPALVNACKPPGEWQKLVIDFRAPRFDESGQKTANARFVKVTLNGQVIQENVEIAHGTNVSRNAPEHPTGPIYLQGDHGAVAFRHLTVTPLD